MLDGAFLADALQSHPLSSHFESCCDARTENTLPKDSWIDMVVVRNADFVDHFCSNAVRKATKGRGYLVLHLFADGHHGHSRPHFDCPTGV
jgi:hypothetical protein